MSFFVFSLLLVSCDKNDASLWQSNEMFKELTVCNYGKVVSAEFGSSCNIKVNNIVYEDFTKYVNDLKEGGFTFFTSGNIPENINLSNGTAVWRCSNKNIFVQLIFSKNESDGFNMFGCNLQIYGYSEKPENW